MYIIACFWVFWQNLVLKKLPPNFLAGFDLTTITVDWHNKCFMCHMTHSDVTWHQLGSILSCVGRCHTLLEGVKWHKNYLSCKYLHTPLASMSFLSAGRGGATGPRLQSKQQCPWHIFLIPSPSHLHTTASAMVFLWLNVKFNSALMLRTYFLECVSLESMADIFILSF
jgi:hypothetical protein